MLKQIGSLARGLAQGRDHQRTHRRELSCNVG